MTFIDKTLTKEQWSRVADWATFQSMVGHLLLALGGPGAVHVPIPWSGKDGGYDARVDDLAKALSDAGVMDLVPAELGRLKGPVMVQATVTEAKELPRKIKDSVEKARLAGCPTLAVFVFQSPKEKDVTAFRALGQENDKSPVKVVVFTPEDIHSLLALAPWVRQRFFRLSALSPVRPIVDGMGLNADDFALPFHGREDDVEKLDAMLRDILEAGGGVGVLSGASGVGKTRLLVEWARRAYAHWAGHHLLSVCDERATKHILDEQAIFGRQTMPVIVVEMDSESHEQRWDGIVRPLLDGLSAHGAKYVVLLVVRASLARTCDEQLRRQKLWKKNHHLALERLSDGAITALLKIHTGGRELAGWRHFIDGSPGMAACSFDGDAIGLTSPRIQPGKLLQSLLRMRFAVPSPQTRSRCPTSFCQLWLFSPRFGCPAHPTS